MNKIFRVIWNHATQSWVAVSELSRAKGKTKSKVTAVAAAVSLGLLSSEGFAAVSDTNPNDNSVMTTDRGTILIGQNSSSHNTRTSPAADKGYSNLAMGKNAVVAGNETIVIGTDAKAGLVDGKKVRFADNSVIIGNKATASSNNTDIKEIVAIGHNSYGGQIGSTAIGANAKAEGLSVHLFRENPYQPYSIVNKGTANESVQGSYTHPITNANMGLVKNPKTGAYGIDTAGAGVYSGAIGTSGTAVGRNTYASGGASAFGDYAVAKTSAVALGSFAVAEGSSSTAIGLDTYAKGNTAIAIGRGSAAAQDYGIAMGNTAASGGIGSIAMGHSAHASDYRSVAIGSSDIFGAGYTFGATGVQLGSAYNSQSQTVATAQDATAIGALSQATGIQSTALGAGADALAQDASAIGFDAKADGNSSTAIGSGSYAHGISATAIADDSLALANQTLALGLNTKALATNAIAIGTNAIAGAASITDAQKAKIATAQNDLNTKQDELTAAISALKAEADKLKAAGAQATQAQKDAYDSAARNYSSKLKAVDDAKVALLAATKELTVGVEAIDSIAIGVNATAASKTSLAVGVDTTVKSEQAGAFGYKNTINTTAGTSYAVGTNNTLNASNTYVLGQNITTTNANGVILGADSQDAKATREFGATVGGVNYGGENEDDPNAFAGNKPIGIVSVGAKGKERQIKNVAAGNISSTSTDAINGSQLYMMMDKLTPGHFSVNDGSSNGTSGAVFIDEIEDPDRFVNATTVATAINNAYWKITRGLGESATDKGTNIGGKTAEDAIRAGDIVKLLAGKYINIKQEFEDHSDDPNEPSVSKFTFSVKLPENPVTYTDNEGNKLVLEDGKYYILDNKGNKTTQTVEPENVKTSLNNNGNVTNPLTLDNLKSTLPETYNSTSLKKDENGNYDIAREVTKEVLSGEDIHQLTPYHNAATVGDVLNAGWNLKANGSPVDFVKPYDTVNFADGMNTKVFAEPDENGTSSTISVNVVGLPVQYTDANGNPVTKVGDNYFTIGADGKPTQTKVDPADLKINAINPTAKPNQTGAPVAINNVESGLTTYDNQTAPDSNKKAAGLVDLSVPAGQAPTVSNNTAATVGDLRNMGWIVSSDKTTGGNGKYADKVQNANEVRFVGTNLATVSGNTTAEGVRIITVDVNAQNVVESAQLPVVYTNSTGSPVYKINKKLPDGTTKTVFNTKPDGTGSEVEPSDVIASMNNGESNTTKPMTLTNIGSNLKPAYNEGDKQVVDGKPSGDATAPKQYTKEQDTTGLNLDNIYNNAATVGDVLNAGWNLKENSNARDFVKAYDTVNFVNGTGTIANVITTPDGKSSNVTFHIDTRPLEMEEKVADPNKPDAKTPTGKVVELTAEELKDPKKANAIATANEVAKAINNSGWVVAAPDTDSGKGYEHLVKNGEKVNFKGSAGVDVVGANNATTGSYDITVKLAKAGELELEDKTEGGEATPTGRIKLKEGSGTNGFVGATNVMDMINAAGFKATIGKDEAEDKDTFKDQKGKKDELINPGDKVVFQSGKNLKVKQEQTGNTTAFTYALEDDISVNSVTIATTTNPNEKANPVTMISDPRNANTLIFGGRDPQDPNQPVPVTMKGITSGLQPYTANNAPDTNKKAKDLVNLDTPNVHNNTVVTVGDLRNMGWVVSSDKTTGDDNKATDTAYADQVKNANEVKFIGKNGAVVSGKTDGNLRTITVDIDANAVKDQIKGNVTVVNNKAALGDISPNVKDDGSKLATTGDVVNAINNSGWTIKGNNGTADVTDVVKPGSSVTFKGANGAKVITNTDNVGNPVVTVDFDKSSILDLAKGTLTDLPNGSVQHTGDIGFATNENVAQTINKSGWTATVGTDNAADKDSFANEAGKKDELINPADKIVFQAGKNLKVKQEQDGTTTKFTYALKDDVELGTKGKTDGSITLNNKAGDSAKLAVASGSPDVNNSTGENGNPNATGNTRIVYTKPDGSKEQVATLNDGLRFEGDTGNEIKRPLNSRLSIKGGQKDKTKLTDNNIGVVAEGNSLTVKLAKDVNLGNDGSLKAGPVTINKDGIDAGKKRITNVAPGKAPTDAVNVSQLKGEINQVNKGYRAGIAGANAAAGLPQVYIPGKSMVAASAGTFKGQSAVAVGYSRASDNGKLLLKIQGNANSQGDVGGSVGVGYQW